MEQKTLNIIFGVVIFICIITMLILYVSMHRKLSNSLTLDKLKVNEIEIDKTVNVNPDLLIKGTYNFDKNLLKDKFKNFDKNKIKIFYIKNDEDTSKIPLELHLDELLYLIYTTNKYKFMETPKNNNEDIPQLRSIEIPKDFYNQNSETKNEEIEPVENSNEQNNELNEETTNENQADNLEDETSNELSVDPKETFKNIPGFNIYYY